MNLSGKSPTIKFSDDIVKQLYSTSYGAQNNSELTPYQKSMQNQGVHRGIELLLDAKEDSTPMFSPLFLQANNGLFVIDLTGRNIELRRSEEIKSLNEAHKKSFINHEYRAGPSLSFEGQEDLPNIEIDIYGKDELGGVHMATKITTKK